MEFKVYESIAPDNLIETYELLPGDTRLFRAGLNYCNIEHQIAMANIFCPKFIEVDGCIILYEYVANNKDIGELVSFFKKAYNNDIKKVEMELNTRQYDWFFMGTVMIDNDDALLIPYLKILQYFWSERLRKLFPDKNVIVEVGEGLFPEECAWCISIYQA